MRLAGLFAVWGAAVGAHEALAEEFNVLNWTDYFEAAVIAEFEDQFGAEVVVDTYLEAEEAEGILLGRATGYDVVVVPTESLERMTHDRALAAIAKTSISDLENLEQGLWPMIEGVMPEASQYAVPYVWGTTGLAFDIEAVTARIEGAPLDSWALIFDPQHAARLSDCGISIADSSEEVVAIVLSYLGRDPASRSEADLDAAFAVLERVSPFVRFFDTQQYDALVDGEACVALAWSSEAFGPIIDEGMQNFRYVVPKEGSNLWADVFVFPVDGPNPQAAMKFVQHMATKGSAVANAQWVFGAVRDASLRALVDEPAYEHPALQLNDDLLQRLFVVRTRQGDEKRALERRWRRMVLGL
ncbi:extracellular solute-binding protein [Shimia sp. MIT1388]|uniref:extracellular solute-binding protein n=1 Tax=Shimia sp. MIT1388 TaxID=3096992 RepID=UPI00399A2B0B